MPLSWNEIKTIAAAFVLEWSDRLLSTDNQSVKEIAEAQTFETEFLKIFGVNRKKVASLNINIDPFKQCDGNQKHDVAMRMSKF